MTATKSQQTATLAGGCFWCTEAIFQRLKGIKNVVSGYTGGKWENPTYEQVSSGTTGHAEAVQLTFDPSIISYERLLQIFFTTHNPTTLNQQGADRGPQYRSAIFYHDDQQKHTALRVKHTLEKEGIYESLIITDIVPYEIFYKAEDHHQNYYNKQPQYPYCTVVINPKVQKLLKQFQEDVKEDYQLA